MAEFQTKKKHWNEGTCRGLEELGQEDLPITTSRGPGAVSAHPFCEPDGGPQLSFAAIRQRVPVKLNVAVAALLEFETLKLN